MIMIEKKCWIDPIGGTLLLEIEQDGEWYLTRITTSEGAVIHYGLQKRSFADAECEGRRIARIMATNILANCADVEQGVLCPGCRLPIAECSGGTLGCAKPKPCASGCPKGGACDEEDC